MMMTQSTISMESYGRQRIAGSTEAKSGDVKRVNTFEEFQRVNRRARLRTTNADHPEFDDRIQDQRPGCANEIGKLITCDFVRELRAARCHRTGNNSRSRKLGAIVAAIPSA